MLDSNSQHDSQLSVQIRGVPLGPVETNCYVVWSEADRSATGTTKQAPCWIIDAGEDPASLIAIVRDNALTPQAIVLTHAHADHIAGLDEVAAAFPKTSLLIHEAEAAWLTDPELNLSIWLGDPISLRTAPTQLLRGGETLTLGSTTWRVFHTPGHSPGGITLWCEAASLALVGDALFAGSIGRTDFPGSDHAQLIASIRERLYTLPDHTRVHPGHGPSTTIAVERRSNPFTRV